MPISKLGHKGGAFPVATKSTPARSHLPATTGKRLNKTSHQAKVGRAPHQITASASSVVTHRLYRGRLKQITKPPKAVKDWLKSPAVKARSASSVFKVPAELMSTLTSAKRVLVVGHPPPDGDSVGSAVGLHAALQLAGIEATVCCDYPVPGMLRGIDGKQSLTAADKLEGRFDTVIIVDGGDAKRLGPRMTQRVKDAKNAIVIDHHRSKVSAETLGRKEGASTQVWQNGHADAAALMVASVAEKLTKNLDLSDEEKTQVFGPLMTGVYTDTSQFAQLNTDPKSQSVFKYHFHSSLSNSLKAVENALSYQAPKESLEHINLHSTKERISAGAAEVTLLAVTDKTVKEAVKIGKKQDSKLLVDDLKGPVLNLLDELSSQKDRAILLFETPKGTAISTRCVEGNWARKLAEHLGGGGHDRSGGAFVPKPLVNVREDLSAWFEASVKKEQAQLKLRTSP